MLNCEDTPQAIQAAKNKAKEEAAAAAAKAGLDAQMVIDMLMKLIGPLLDLLGARKRKELVDKYMQTALSLAARNQGTLLQGDASNPAGAGTNMGGPALSQPWYADGTGSRPAGPGGILGGGGYVPPGGGPSNGGISDPLRPPPGVDGTSGTNLPGLPNGSIPRPGDGVDTEDDALSPLNPDDPDYGLPSSVLPGIPVTPAELKDYYEGIPGCNDYKFVIANWIHPEDNPTLLLDDLALAKRMHRSIIMPIARYYHTELFGSPDSGPCLVHIKYGVTSPPFARKRLGAGVTSRKMVVQSVNFQLFEIPDEVVVADIAAGRIGGIRVGTFGVSNGIHASLPFYVGGEAVEGMLLYKDLGVPGFVGYDWT